MTKIIGVLASGRGSDFQSIIDHISLGVLKNARIGVLISNNADAYALKRAEQAGIDPVYIEGIQGKKFLSSEAREKEREIFDKKAVGVLKQHNVDLVVLAGFMQVLTPFFVDQYRWRIMNIHPAKNMEKYSGRGMYGERVHEAVLKAGEKESGCTIHYVDKGVDTGPIILQDTVPVKPSDNVHTLADRILVYEHRLYSKAAQLHIDGRLKIVRVNVEKDYGGSWEEEWNERQKAYIEYQKTEWAKIGKPLEDLL